MKAILCLGLISLIGLSGCSASEQATGSVKPFLELEARIDAGDGKIRTVQMRCPSKGQARCGEDGGLIALSQFGTRDDAKRLQRMLSTKKRHKRRSCRRVIKSGQRMQITGQVLGRRVNHVSVQRNPCDTKHFNEFFRLFDFSGRR